MHFIVDLRDVEGCHVLHDVLLFADIGNLGSLLGFNLGSARLGLSLFFHHLLPLDRDHKLGFLSLHLLIVAPNLLRDFGLCDANGDNFDTSVVLSAVSLQRLLNPVVDSVKLLNVNFLQCMLRAELIDLVMELGKDPDIVIVNTIVSYGIHHMVLRKSVDHLNLVEVEQHPTSCSARNVDDLIRLNRGLNLRHRCNERHLSVESCLGIALQESPSPIVDSHVPLLDLVDGQRHHQREDGDEDGRSEGQQRNRHPRNLLCFVSL
mmetsp:Transcript_2261/g.4537  ORF Transcript_2261/g.4537 Transcript_2261/m.4537 type:complete len:263 (-) Transcript_2261:114-902(-)